MLRVLAKPFTGLQMTQLGGQLQGLFAPCSNLHFSAAHIVACIARIARIACIACIVARAEQTRLSDLTLCLIPAVVDLLPKSANQRRQEIGERQKSAPSVDEICMYQ